MATEAPAGKTLERNAGGHPTNRSDWNESVAAAFATRMMQKEMEKIDVPPVREFLEMIHDAGGEIYACKASVDMFHLTLKDFCPHDG